MPPSDLIRMTFDPRHDHLTAVTFDTNPSGVQADYAWFDDTRQNSDYEAVWEVSTTIDAEGWNAEYRIPFSQMRFPAPSDERMVWGFNVRRDIFVRGEYDRWVPTPRGAQGFVSRMGHLVFDDSFTPPRRLELLPFTLARLVDVTAAPASRSASVGLDSRVGLGTSATLSATLNPDFAQVEQDPAVLNLTIFETFFPEKRPFFLEDSRTFVLPYGQFPLFNSRRIGQAPGRLPLPAGRSVDRQARADHDSRLGESHRQDVRLDLRRADLADRARVRRGRDDRGGRGREFDDRAHRAADRAAGVVQRRAAATRHRCVQCRRHRHGGDAGAVPGCVHRRRRLQPALEPESLYARRALGGHPCAVFGD